MVGGANTVTLALEVLPGPPSVEVTVTLLFLAPDVAPVTFTDSVHDALAARVAPDKLMEPLPGTATTVPLHVPVTPLEPPTTNPAGNVSMNPTPVSEIVLMPGLVMTNP